MHKFLVLFLISLISFVGISQQLISVNPNTGTRGTYLTVTITGQNTNFNQLSSTLSVRIEPSQGSSTIYSYSKNATSSTNLYSTFYIPSNAILGFWNLIVNSSVNGTMTYNNAINILAQPSIQTVNPDTAILGQTLWVTITTSNTNFSQGSPVLVSLSQASSTTLYASVTTVNNPTSVDAKFTIPAPYTIGYYDVNLSNLTKFNGLYINGGTSSIAGSISLGTKSSSGSTPVPNLDLYLMSVKNDTLLTTTTDGNGEFTFNYLAYGTYKLFGDNLNNQHPVIITLDVNNPNAEELNILLRGDSLVSGIDMLPDANVIKVFPNPYSSSIIVEIFTEKRERVDIDLYDISGRFIDHLVINETVYLQKTLDIKLDDKSVKSNIHLLKVSFDGQTAKYIKILHTE